ncbi:MAG: hypothetical protein K2Q32_04015 [Alphaproteobacteria bacterium]|nr:hypothetical protein [Alphaproteobacteria bacterium]
MASKKQHIDFYGDTAHRDDTIINYFTSDAFFQRLITDKKKHLALEFPYTLQPLVDELSSGRITKEEYAKKFATYFSDRDKQNKSLTKDDLDFTAKTHALNADKSADTILGAKKHGIKVYFVDHADGILDPKLKMDPINQAYGQRNITPRSDDEKEQLESRERLAQDPVVAKRILDAFKGEDGAVKYGWGHAEHARGIPHILKANGVDVKLRPVLNDVDYYVKRNYENKYSRSMGLALNHGRTDTAIDANTGKDIPMPQKMLDGAESTRGLEGRWIYNPTVTQPRKGLTP